SNANFVFKGNVDFQDPQHPEFFFDANIEHLDLTKLNLMPTFKVARVASKSVKLRFTGNSVDNIIGDIDIQDLKIFGIPKPPENAKGALDPIYTTGGYYFIDSIQVSSSHSEHNSKNLTLRSDLADMDFYGTFEFIPMLNDLKRRLSLVLPVLNIQTNPKIKSYDQNFTFEIIVKNLAPITELFVPQFKIGKSILFGSYNNESKELDLLFKSSGKSKLQYGSIKVETWDFKAENVKDSLR